MPRLSDDPTPARPKPERPKRHRRDAPLHCTTHDVAGGCFREDDPSWPYRERCPDPIRSAIWEGYYLAAGCNSLGCPEDVRVRLDSGGRGWSAYVTWELGRPPDRHRLPPAAAALCEALRRDPRGVHPSIQFVLPPPEGGENAKP